MKASNDPWTERLSEYVDGELAPAEAQALASHLEACERCRALAADLERIRAEARALRDREPERDLWPAIAAELESSSAREGSSNWRTWFLVAAAALVAFVLGRALQPERLVDGPELAGQRFVLLLHEPPNLLSDATEEDVRRVIGEYGAWSRGLAAEGKIELGEKLADGEGFDLFADATRARPSGPPSSEQLGGFFLVRAPDYEAALAIARTCPHLKYGGWIEVRRIQET